VIVKIPLMQINVKAIILGQVLALMQTGSGVFTNLLALLGLNLPLFQVVVFYFLLALIFDTKLLYNRAKLTRRELLVVMLAAVTDSQANLLYVMAYSYSSLTSVLVLANIAVPFTFTLSFIFLKKQFTKFELGGVLVAMTGIICVVLSDLQREGWVWGGYFVGDLMVIGGTALYCL
jgi:drug/metabolite transporter (DMT)-like permease